MTIILIIHTYLDQESPNEYPEDKSYVPRVRSKQTGQELWVDWDNYKG